MFWTSSRKEKRKWANTSSLIGLFEIEWKIPRHNTLVEFFNNQKLNFEHNYIKVMMTEEQKIINIHLLAIFLKISHIGDIKIDQAKTSHARIGLANITDKVPNSYNINEGWVVKKMKPRYVNRIATILPIIYQKNMVQYFNNKSTMMISKANH